LLALINQLLDLSRLEAGHMQLQARPENLDAFLKPLVMSFTSLADQRRILLEYRSPEADLEVYVDPDKLYKIVTNLISNA
ncbi:MAG: HAMP domain-containing histidine kinase, partial [Calditrichaeota bacterium]|nr:HAMP domain-containing histidine kinase [Calditrichota bacterium]